MKNTHQSGVSTDASFGSLFAYQNFQIPSTTTVCVVKSAPWRTVADLSVFVLTDVNSWRKRKRRTVVDPIVRECNLVRRTDQGFDMGKVHGDDSRILLSQKTNAKACRKIANTNDEC